MSDTGINVESGLYYRIRVRLIDTLDMDPVLEKAWIWIRLLEKAWIWIRILELAWIWTRLLEKAGYNPVFRKSLDLDPVIRRLLEKAWIWTWLTEML